MNTYVIRIESDDETGKVALVVKDVVECFRRELGATNDTYVSLEATVRTHTTILNTANF